MSDDIKIQDGPRCPYCHTLELVITYQAGYRACFECGKELDDDFPSEEIWEFVPNPYGWRPKNKDSTYHEEFSKWCDDMGIGDSKY